MSGHELRTLRMFAMAKVGTPVLAAVALSISTLGCRNDAKADRHASHVAEDSVAQLREATAGGEVVTSPELHPQASPVRWITDANALSLVAMLNARQIAAADLELENWHVDTARAFAASMAREHAELQHSVDSMASSLNLKPVSPALTKRWTASMQAQIDTMRRAGESGLDLAFVQQQTNSHQLMADYLLQLAAVAERPEWRAFLEAAASRAASQAQRARVLQPVVGARDSARRDAARRRGTTS